MTEGRDYIQLAADYQAGVLDGSIPACRGVKQACARNRRDLDRQETDGFPYRFDPSAAIQICRFAELLPYVSGRGFAEIVGLDDDEVPIWRTIELQPWQCWFLTTLYGWMNAKGLRRFRVAILLVARKNTKSTLGAIMALYGLTEEGEPGAQAYSAATTRDQAKAVAEIAWEMARRSPRFREHYGVRMGSETTRSLSVPSMASKFMPLSADANSLDGLNVSLAIVDELHAHKTAAVWNVLDTATGTRLQPLLVAISTAGVDVGGICYQQMGYLEKVLDGVAVDESFFGVNYTIDKGEESRLTDVVVQQKANPNWGVSVQPDDLSRKIAAAQHSPAALNNVLTKHFNVWIRSESGWMMSTTWQTCSEDGLTLESLKAFPLWIGVDLGETRDPSSLALLFKTAPGTFAFIPWIYMPADVVDSSPIAGMTGWTRTGDIIKTTGNEADYMRIEDDLLEFFTGYQVQEIDFDRRSARLMMQNLRAKLEPTLGRDRVERVVLDIPQSVDTMDPAMKTLEALILGKKLRHNGNQAMAWMISNIVVERDHKGQIYPRKAGGKDSANKIDGPVALFTCLSRAMQATAEEPTYQIIVAGGSRR